MESSEEETLAVPDYISHCWDCGDGSDCFKAYDDDDDDNEEPADSLLRPEENDFPSFELSSDPEDEDTVPYIYNDGNRSNGPNGKKSMGDEADEEDSFASHFYRCGTDWSCLLQIDNNVSPNNDNINDDDNNNNNNDNNKKRRFKQTNLFQMWGFQKKNPHHDYDDKAAASLPPLEEKQSKKALIRVPSNSTSTNNTSAGLEKDSSSGTGSASVVAYQQRPRLCPFYKKIPGTPFTVDAFRYGHVKSCSAYFLSHFHADHYGGLSKGWSHGPIYCTLLTARLVRMLLYVNPSYICPLELGTEYVIEGIKVTLLEANHCPGASLIHFRLPDGQCYLHTGDFRASRLMQAYPLLVNKQINVLYLDTTYCNPKYKFPSKQDVLSFVVRISKNYLKKQPKTLVIVGAYSIGKECVYLEISKALGVKIYANASRRRILQSFGWPEVSRNLCTHGHDSPLHVLPISSLRFEILERYLKSYMRHYTSVLAFRPTGWTYSETIGSHLDSIKPSSRGTVTIYGVPYSEHSSFTELREFVQFLRPEKIIPTVNVGNAANRYKMQSYFREWLKG